jgi:outer membrane immunogenic protein
MIRRIAWLAISIASSLALAQQAPGGASAFAPLELTLAYSADRTNAPPGGCSCFWMAGSKAESNASFGHGLSVVAELSGQHAGSINTAHESLSLVSYLFGPRYSIRTRTRVVPFAQFLAGGVRGFDAIFPTAGASGVTSDAFGFAAGGGLNAIVSRRLAVRVIQADYFQTQLPNAADDRENHLRLSAGVVLRFGSGTSRP